MSDILVTTIGLSCGRDLHCSLLGPLAKVAQQSEPKAKKLMQRKPKIGETTNTPTLPSRRGIFAQNPSRLFIQED